MTTATQKLTSTITQNVTTTSSTTATTGATTTITASSTPTPTTFVAFAGYTNTSCASNPIGNGARAFNNAQFSVVNGTAPRGCIQLDDAISSFLYQMSDDGVPGNCEMQFYSTYFCEDAVDQQYNLGQNDDRCFSFATPAQSFQVFCGNT